MPESKPHSELLDEEAPVVAALGNYRSLHPEDSGLADEACAAYRRLVEQYEVAQSWGRDLHETMEGWRERAMRAEEQLEAERGLANVFRRVLAQSHSLSGEGQDVS